MTEDAPADSHNATQNHPQTDQSQYPRQKRWLRHGLLSGGLLLLIGSEPVLAQDVGSSFCQTSLAQTVKNVFTLIQFGGPLVGGVVALGAAVTGPMVSRVDLKKELKETRNQALVWGVLVAPLGTALLQFLLNNVVAGGASCTF